MEANHFLQGFDLSWALISVIASLLAAQGSNWTKFMITFMSSKLFLSAADLQFWVELWTEWVETAPFAY